MRWRQWNTSQELGFASRMCGWTRRASKDRVVLSAMCTRTHLQRTAVVPAQPVPSPTTPHQSTVQHSHHRHTHTFTPQQASMPSQTKPHRNRHKNQQHHRDRRHTCPDAPEQARPLVLPPAPSCISVSLSLSRLHLLLPFFKHHFLSNSSSTQQHVKATHRHANKDRNLHLLPPHHCECVGGSGTHHKSWGLQAECVDGGDVQDVQAKIESS